MAKLTKKTIRLILCCGVAALLLIALIVLLLLPSGGAVDGSSSNASTLDTTIKLVEQKQENVKNIHIKNKNGEYDIVTTGTKEWSIKALDGFEQVTNLYSLATNEVATVKADKILLDTQQNLEQYGLDQPTTVVTATFADGSTFQMNIGDVDPVSGGNYMTVAGKDPIYIYNGASYFAYDLTDYLSTTIFNIEAPTTTVSTASGTQTTTDELILDKMEIHRKGESKPITLIKTDKETAEAHANLAGKYLLTSPCNAFVDDANLNNLITGFTQLTASSAEVIRPTDAEKKARGLDDPAVTVRVSYRGKTYTLLIGDAITCESTDDPDSLASNHVHSVIGYNVMRDGTDIIYQVAESNLPWMTFRTSDILSSFVVLSGIADVKTLTVTYDGQTHVFEINKQTVADGEDGEKTDYYAPIYNGKVSIDEEYFKTYYQVVLGLYQSGLNDGTTAGKLMMTVRYDYLDSSKKPDKLEIYENGTGGYILSHNGDMAYMTRLSYINNLKEATEKIIKNEEPLIN